MIKSLSCTFAFLTICLFVYGQNTDTVQPDSLYKKLKVHLRSSVYEGSLSKSKEIFIFDKRGMFAGFVLTDNESGNIPQMRMDFKYNDKGILSAETDTSFRGDKYIAKSAELEYLNGALLKKTLKGNNGIVSETTYSNDENKETEKLFRDKKVYREQSSYYDAHHKKIRFTGTEVADKDAKPKIFMVNGKTYTFNPPKTDEKWDYTFENTYDRNGNLITQKRFSEGKMQDETDFTYDESGLLKEQIEIRLGNKQVIKFEYTYY